MGSAIVRLGLVCFLLVAPGGCGLPEEAHKAEAQIARIHAQLAAGDFDAIWREASPEFRAHTSARAYERFQEFHSRLGAALSFTRENWAAASSTARGIHVSMTIRTVFANGRAKESFTFKQTSEGLRLLRYDVHEVTITRPAQTARVTLRPSA